MADQYKAAGVDLEAGYDSVRRIKSHVARTTVLQRNGVYWSFWRDVRFKSSRI